MKQADYEIILACIQHGAPALAPQLVPALNNTIENSNNFISQQRQAAEEAKRLEQQANSGTAKKKRNENQEAPDTPEATK